MSGRADGQSAAEGTHRATAERLRAELGAHDLPRHLALFYWSNEAQLAASTAFLVEGLRSGHRCIYLLDVNSAGDIKSALKRANVDVDGRLDAGDLVIRDAEEVYLDSGFDPSRMVGTIEDEADASLEAGYEGLWLAGENSWCFHTEESFDHVLDFEAEFDATCPDLPVTALCQYDLERFNETSAAKALWTHERIIYRNQLCTNPFYIPPEEYRSASSSELNAKLMLEQAYSLTDARRDVDEREQRLGIVNRVLRHNIRNDLNLVQGALELIDESELSPESRRRLATAIEHAESVVEIAEKARYIRRTTGDTTVKPQRLGRVIETAIDEARGEYPDAKVQFSGAEGVTVLADENLDIALREAIENGIVHQDTDAPTVVVSVSRPREDTVQIEVRNEGAIPNVERYSLEKGEETPLEHSSGLGLWLIKWIVENAHGSIGFPDPNAGEARLQIELYRIPS